MKEKKKKKQEKRREEEKQKKGKKKKKKEKAERVKVVTERNVSTGQGTSLEQETFAEQGTFTDQEVLKQKTSLEQRGFGERMQTSEPGKSTQVFLNGREELQEEQASLVFRALGDPVRLRILSLLEERELCAAELLKGLSIVQSTLSHHMKVLCEAGIVSCRRHGRWSSYSVAADRMEQAAGYLRRYGKGTEYRES